MMFKLSTVCREKLATITGFNYLAKVIAGIQFKDGIEVTEVDQVAA